jgi:hypothetical protein
MWIVAAAAAAAASAGCATILGVDHDYAVEDSGDARDACDAGPAEADAAADVRCGTVARCDAANQAGCRQGS